MRLIDVSSEPNAFVATQVNKAESALSARFILIVDKTPPSLVSSLIVYLKCNKNVYYALGCTYIFTQRNIHKFFLGTKQSKIPFIYISI